MITFGNISVLLLLEMTLISPAVLPIVVFMLEGLGPWPVAARLVRADGAALGRARVLALAACVAAGSVAGLAFGSALLLPGNSLLMVVIDSAVLLCVAV